MDSGYCTLDRHLLHRGNVLCGSNVPQAYMGDRRFGAMEPVVSRILDRLGLAIWQCVDHWYCTGIVLQLNKKTLIVKPYQNERK